MVTYKIDAPVTKIVLECSGLIVIWDSDNKTVEVRRAECIT